jgi:integrase/recombinase XerD
MGRLQDEMKMDMELKNLSLRTMETYLGCVRGFATHYGKPPDEMGYNEIRDYLYYLLKDKKASQSAVNQAYSALKFLYQTTLRREWDTIKIPR